MANLQDVLDLKVKQTKLQSAADQAKGKLASLRTSLKEDWGCKNMQEARDKLLALEVTQNQLEAAFDKKVRAFKEEWSDELARVG